MKKKRFLKLMMARGIQRNKANQLAKEIKTIKTYKELYIRCCLYQALEKAAQRSPKRFPQYENAQQLFTGTITEFRGTRMSADLAKGKDRCVIQSLNTENNVVKFMSREERECIHGHNRR